MNVLCWFSDKCSPFGVDSPALLAQVTQGMGDIRQIMYERFVMAYKAVEIIA